MAKKNLTPQQILQYLLSGGDIETLAKEGDVSQRQLLQVLVTNPEVFTAFREQARGTAAGLDRFDPTSWYSADEAEPVNYITEQYAAMEEPARNLAFDYFNDVAKAGANPIRLAEIQKYYEDPTIAESYGIPNEAKFLLMEKIKEDAPKWFSEELQTQRTKNEKNYKAFQAQREGLDVRQGESALSAALRKTTGFGELADVPDPRLTFADVAKKRAEQLYVSERQKKIEKMPVTRVDEFMGSKEYKKLAQGSAAKQKSREIYEKAFLEMAMKKGGKKATPYSESIKKMLPAIATRLSVEG